MDNIVLIDYGVHSFTHSLAIRLQRQLVPVRYLINGSLESPNLTSVDEWQLLNPSLIRIVRCRKPYGKLNLTDRIKGEREWAANCIRALSRESVRAVVASCLPLSVVARVQRWCKCKAIPFIYWLQDLQGRAIGDLLGRKLGRAGQIFGQIALKLEQRVLAASDFVIIISGAHSRHLPRRIREEGRFALLENWANIEDWPALPRSNAWAVRNGVDKTRNIVYSGTLGFKHDLGIFLRLAERFSSPKGDVRVIIVSAGGAADWLRSEATERGLSNLIVFPFQDHRVVPEVLACATVVIAPLDPAASSFCVPSKVLTYLCAGRPLVVSLDQDNTAAKMIAEAGAGRVVAPGDPERFVTSVEHFLFNPQLAFMAGHAARDYAERTFSEENVLARFRQILSRANIILPDAHAPVQTLTSTAAE